MTTGKNKLLRYARLYLGGYNLSGDARTFDTLECGYGEQDMSGWSDQIRHSLADKVLAVGIRGFQALLNDTALSGAFTLLKSPDGVTRDVLSLLLGGGAAPAAGDPAYILTGAQISDPAGLDGKALVIRGDFVPVPGYMDGVPWGVVLHPETLLSATTNGSTIDNGAATANGWHACLHVVTSSGGTWVLKIEHSTDGLSWATLGTFTANGSAVTGEYLTGAGTVNRYTRFVATRTSGTVTPVCSLARK